MFKYYKKHLSIHKNRRGIMRKSIKKNSKESFEDVPKPSEEFLRIKEVILKINIEEDWNEIKNWLSKEEKTIKEYKDSLIVAPSMIQKASNLKNLAISEYKLYKLSSRDRIQLWREEAIDYWELRKEHGLKKQITEAMIDDRIIENHNKLYCEIKENEIYLEKIVDTFENLEQTTIGKQVNLRKILSSESEIGIEKEIGWIKE